MQLLPYFITLLLQCIFNISFRIILRDDKTYKMYWISIIIYAFNSIIFLHVMLVQLSIYMFEYLMEINMFIVAYDTECSEFITTCMLRRHGLVLHDTVANYLQFIFCIKLSPNKLNQKSVQMKSKI